MVFTNDQSKEKIAVKKLNKNMLISLVFVLVVIGVCGYFINLFQDVKNQLKPLELLIVYVASIVIWIYFIFTVSKKNEKGFRNYSLEITDTKIISIINDIQTIIPIEDIEAILKTNKNQIVIKGKGYQRVFISEYIEQKDELSERLLQIEEQIKKK